MNAIKTIQLLNEYATCRNCRSEAIGNGEGSIEVIEDTFKRTCKCGWGVEIKEETEE